MRKKKERSHQALDLKYQIWSTENGEFGINQKVFEKKCLLKRKENKRSKRKHKKQPKRQKKRKSKWKSSQTGRAVSSEYFMDGWMEARQKTHHQSCWPAPPGPWLFSGCLAGQMYSCPEEEEEERQSGVNMEHQWVHLKRYHMYADSQSEWVHKTNFRHDVGIITNKEQGGLGTWDERLERTTNEIKINQS